MFKNNYRLSDEVIAEISKLLQISILTGTDIVDQLRTIRLDKSEDNYLTLCKTYKEISEGNIERMLTEIEGLKNQKENTER